MKSKTEQALLKKLRDKNPPDIVKKVIVDEFADIWAEPATLSKTAKSFKDFSKNVALIVKAVIEPTPGQSFNPTSIAHKKTLKQAVTEEIKEIEKNFKGTIKQHAMSVPHNDLS